MLELAWKIEKWLCNRGIDTSQGLHFSIASAKYTGKIHGSIDIHNLSPGDIGVNTAKELYYAL